LPQLFLPLFHFNHGETMIQITQSLVRQLRAVFRKAAPKNSGTRPAVSFQTDEGGLHVRLYQAPILMEYQKAGDYRAEALSLPLEALADLESRKDAVVTLAGIKGGQVEAKWQDGSIPRVMQYDAPDVSLTDYPTAPKKMAVAAPGLLEVLAEGSRSCSRDAVRYATSHLQLRGRAGAIVATDGRQLLIQNGIELPWQEDVLVPGSAVFDCKELPSDGARIGKTDSHIVIQTGVWTLFLPINREGRYPNTDSILPRGGVRATCRFGAADAAFLVRTLPRLPGAQDENSPVTLDLNGRVVVRTKASGQAQAAEVILASSAATGTALKVCLNREFLGRAVQLGLGELCVTDPDSPVLFKDEKRKLVVMPLPKKDCIGPTEGAIQIQSDRAPLPHQPTERRKPVMPRPTDNGHPPAPPPSNQREHEQNGQRGSLLQEAQTLKDLLRDAYLRSSALLNAVKQQKKQSRLVASTVAALRQLHRIDS